MTIAFQFDPAKHLFTVDGVTVPSVTQILKSVGLINFAGIPASVLNHKRDVGSAVHLATHYLDEDALDWSTVSEECEPYVRAYESFKRNSGFEPELIEYKSVAQVDGMRFGMIVDRTGVIGGKPTLLELKTGEPSASWPVQLAGYKLGLGGVRQRVALQLTKKGKYKIHTFADRNDEPIFKAALALCCWKRNVKLEEDADGNPSIGD